MEEDVKAAEVMLNVSPLTLNFISLSNNISVDQTADFFTFNQLILKGNHSVVIHV